jgi:hypothetical protein
VAYPEDHQGRFPYLLPWSVQVGARSFGFSFGPPLSYNVWAWVTVGFLVDSQGLDGILYPEIEKIIYFQVD